MSESGSTDGYHIIRTTGDLLKRELREGLRLMTVLCLLSSCSICIREVLNKGFIYVFRLRQSQSVFHLHQRSPVERASIRRRQRRGSQRTLLQKCIN